MTDRPTSRRYPGYELTLTIREIDGTSPTGTHLRFRAVKAVTWSPHDGLWSQREKQDALRRCLVKCGDEMVSWASGQEL